MINPADEVDVAFDFCGKHFAHTIQHPEAVDFKANNGLDEQDVMHALVRYVQPGDRVIDAGANIGVFTVMLSQLVGAQGLVWAFEPDPTYYEILCHNIELNAMRNVISSTFALWDENREQLRFSSMHGGLSTAAFYVLNPESKEITVRARSLDTLLSDHFRLMKLDCEGAEILILQGARKLLARHEIDYVIVEFNFYILDTIKLKEKQIRDFMRLFGYNAFLLLPTGSPPIFIPPEKTLNVEPLKELGPPRCNVLFSYRENIEQEWQSLI